MAEIALIQAELGEATEEHRKDTPYLYTLAESPKPEGIAAEFADAIILILDASKKRGIPVIQALIDKAEFNRTRPHRHGGKHV